MFPEAVKVGTTAEQSIEIKVCQSTFQDIF